jgi:hypothetical protein
MRTCVICLVHTVSAPESIECFMKDQASLRSHDSAPRPPPSPLSPSPVHSLSRQQVVSFSQSSCVVCRQSTLLTGEVGGGGGRGAKSDDRKKAWPSINHSVLSDLQYISPSLLLPLCEGPEAKVTKGLFSTQ